MSIPNFQFANPWCFLLLPILVLLYYFVNKRFKPQLSALTISHSESFKSKSTVVGKFSFTKLLQSLAILCLVIAMARPQKTLSDDNATTYGVDIMLVLDLSSSMLSQDFDPNRIAVAQRVAAQFIDKRPNDRMGLVVFSGEAFLKCPLTLDHDVVKTMIKKIEIGQLSDGTAIGMGLGTAVNHLKGSKAKSQIVILMTDGVNNTGFLSPTEALDIAKALKTKVYTVGIGSKGEAMSPIGRRIDGNYVFGIVPVEIDEVLLEKIARETGGAYFRATNENELTEIYTKIDALEKSVIEAKIKKQFVDYFSMFLIAAIFLLFLERLLTFLGTEKLQKI